jgi:hypothetical protein
MTTYQKVKKFYDEVINQNIISPLLINDAYKLIHPEETNPECLAYRTKQKAIVAYIENYVPEYPPCNISEEMFDNEIESGIIVDNGKVSLKQIDITETADIDTATNDSVGTVLNQPLHSHEEGFDQCTPEYRLEQLQRELDNCGDSTETRSLRMRITNLKKKLNK